MYNAEDWSKPVQEHDIRKLMSRFATEPILYSEEIMKNVVEAVYPNFEITCTANEAYDAYGYIIDQINNFYV